MPGTNHQIAAFDAVQVLEESTLWRSRCARTIGIIRAAVTGAEEELGLLEPAHRATQMRAIDGKYLKVSIVGVTNPCDRLRGIAIAGAGDGIHELGQPRLANRKGTDRAERNPFVLRAFFLHRRTQQKADNRHSQNRAHHSVQTDRHLEEKATPRGCAGVRVLDLSGRAEPH